MKGDGVFCDECGCEIRPYPGWAEYGEGEDVRRVCFACDVREDHETQTAAQTS